MRQGTEIADGQAGRGKPEAVADVAIKKFGRRIEAALDAVMGLPLAGGFAERLFLESDDVEQGPSGSAPSIIEEQP